MTIPQHHYVAPISQAPGCDAVAGEQRCGFGPFHRVHFELTAMRPPVAAHLSPGTLAVLKLLAEGRAQAEVAAIRGVSVQTIKNTLNLAYRTLDADSLVGAFVRLGWLVPGRTAPDIELAITAELAALSGDIDAIDGRAAQLRAALAALQETTIHRVDTTP